MLLLLLELLLLLLRQRIELLLRQRLLAEWLLHHRRSHLLGVRSGGALLHLSRRAMREGRRVTLHLLHWHLLDC